MRETCTAVAIATCLLAPAAAAATLDQQYTESRNAAAGIDGPGSAEGLGFREAQSFTAGLTGTLDQAELNLNRFASAVTSLTVEIRDMAANGRPGANVLAAAVVPASAVPASGFAYVPVTFSVPAYVVAGRTYAIVAAAQGSDHYGWGARTPGTYAGGAAFASPPSSGGEWFPYSGAADAHFRTYVTVDTTAPTVTITGAPAARTSSTSASVAFSSTATDIARFECEVDGAGGFSACESPVALTELADGPHELAVRAVDLAGNTGPVATSSWVVDTVAPTTTITSAPSVQSSDSSARFSFSSSASDVARYECEADSGGFASCTSPTMLAGLADGGHTFRARAVDTAGNIGPADSHSWTVDTTPPETTITSGPSGKYAEPNVTNDRTPEFRFTANETSTFACRIDAGEWAPCTTPFSSPALADGHHTFEVRATDGLGHADPTPAKVTFVVQPSCSTAKIAIGIGSLPLMRLCLFPVYDDNATIARAGGSRGRATRGVVLLTRGTRTVARGTIARDATVRLQALREIRPGRHVVTTRDVRGINGRRLAGRAVVTITAAQARLLNHS